MGILNANDMVKKGYIDVLKRYLGADIIQVDYGSSNDYSWTMRDQYYIEEMVMYV